jgi:nitroreductase
MIHEIIKNRYSTRAFSEKPVDREKIVSLFEAARWSPSSRNEQPWRFIVGLKEEPVTFNKIAEILNPANRIWASKAPLLILTIAKLNINSTEQINRHALHDLGLAIANLTFQASAVNLYVHQMGGFDQQKARDIFMIPDNYEPVTVLAVGYKGDLKSLPANLKNRELSERIRKDLSDLVFSEKFGQASNIIENKQMEAILNENDYI